MTIKPVGRPLPAIPIKRPYGSTRPGLPPPPPSFVSSGPPPEVIYGAGSAPHPPSLFGHPPGLIGSYHGFKKPGAPAFSSKPVYETGSLSEGFDFESNSQFIDKKQIALRPSVGSDAVQQHVHHHYHHSDGTVGATIPGGSSFSASPISQGPLSYGSSYGNIGTSYDIPSSGVLGGGFQDLDDYKKAFKVKGPGGNEANGFGSASASSYADKYPVYEKPTRDFAYTKPESHKTGKYFTAGNYVSSNAVHASSNDYLASGSTNNFLYGNGNDNDAFKNDFFVANGECVCIPYEQCPRENAGRKDDLFLAIDPRNLNKNIEAEGIIAAEKNGANGTSTIVQIAKNGEVDSNVSQISAEEEQSTEEQANVRSKREATSDESIEGRKKSNGEGVRAVRNSLLNFSRLNTLRIVNIKLPQDFQFLYVSI